MKNPRLLPPNITTRVSTYILSTIFAHFFSPFLCTSSFLLAYVLCCFFKFCIWFLFLLNVPQTYVIISILLLFCLFIYFHSIYVDLFRYRISYMFAPTHTDIQTTKLMIIMKFLCVRKQQSKFAIHAQYGK